MEQRREFPPEAQAVRRVRRLMTQIAGVTQDHVAVLVASELATNAVRHARTRFEVAITARESIRIEVIDEAPVTPAMTDPSEHGLGMRIVAQLSDRWGADQMEGNGKVVWAEVPLSPGASNRTGSDRSADTPLSDERHPWRPRGPAS